VDGNLSNPAGIKANLVGDCANEIARLNAVRTSHLDSKHLEEVTSDFERLAISCSSRTSWSTIFIEVSASIVTKVFSATSASSIGLVGICFEQKWSAIELHSREDCCDLDRRCFAIDQALFNDAFQCVLGCGQGTV
jgi:hypothetical protein